MLSLSRTKSSFNQKGSMRVGFPLSRGIHEFMLDGDPYSRGGLAREEVRRLLEALAGGADPLRLDFPYLSPTSFRLLVGRARLIDWYDGDVIRLIDEMVDFGHRPTPEVHVSLDDVKPRGLNDDIVENDPWNTHSV